MHVCPQALPSEEELAPGPLPVPEPPIPPHLLLPELPPLEQLEPIPAAGAADSRAGPPVGAAAGPRAVLEGPPVGAAAGPHAGLEEGSQDAGCCLLAAGC